MKFDLKKLLWKSINKAGIARQVEAALAIEKAQALINDILPDQEKKSAKVLYLKDQLLTVACLSSAVAQEIKLNEPRIINQLNQQFNKEIVKRLRFLL